MTRFKRHRHHLDLFYDEVIEAMEQPDTVFVIGPGEAKVQLQDRLTRARLPRRPHVETEAADTLTERQVIARVKAHFDAASLPAHKGGR